MSTAASCVLTINGGSSSIRFAVFESAGATTPVLAGKIERIGLSGTNLTAAEQAGKVATHHQIAIGRRQSAERVLLDWLESRPVFGSIKAVGHRVVHGMKRADPERVTPKLLADLRRITPYDPEHLPREIGLMEAFAKRRRTLPQVACFDTAFHRSMPRVAKLLPIPRRYTSRGVERYGFHGLSYAYLMDELSRIDPAASKGRIILAHLGNGASLAAVRNGKSVDTSMGFTPTAGIVMGTRPGDLDPGLAFFLSRTQRMTPAGFNRMINRECGLLGISGTSSDMRDLCESEAKDVRAAEAVELFCYQARKWIGSFAAVLGGLDTLVFAAGIGENSPVVRHRICKELGFLGIEVDPGRNERHSPVISPDSCRVKVRVMHTDEEVMIARLTLRVLGLAEAGRT